MKPMLARFEIGCTHERIDHSAKVVLRKKRVALWCGCHDGTENSSVHV
jgi:hypothetical protein